MMNLTAGGHPAQLLMWMFRPEGWPRYVDDLNQSAWKAGQALARAPFDAVRAQYAGAVRSGLIERSMLASRDFHNQLGEIERLALGPLATRP